MRQTGKIALIVGIIGVGIAVLIMFGARLGLWEPITGFRLYRTYFNLLAGIVAGVGFLALVIHLIRKEKRQAVLGGLATLIGAVLLIPLISSTLNPTPAAYPDIAPLETDLAADDDYQRALTVAEDMGWEIVTIDAERHRFEATARTAVFYFADDVVIVVTPQDGGSRVDMRGVSRVGRSDQGVNAARIRTFQEKFQN